MGPFEFERGVPVSVVNAINLLAAGSVSSSVTINGIPLVGNITLTPAIIGSPAGSGTSTGTNTGDQTITLTGAISGSGTGNIVTTPTVQTGTGAFVLNTAPTIDKLKVNVGLNANTTIQVTAKQDPAGGVGAEVAFDGTAALFIGYNRTTAAFIPVLVAGSQINFFANAVQLGAPGMTADIQWGKALVALGGGAAAALGTIGGTGPVGAGQNGWVRMVDSAGIPCWVPEWK